MTEEYASYEEWKGWSADDFGRYTRAESVYFAAELRRSGIGSLAGLSVLEIGFGNGSFAGWARELGAGYVGLEAIPDLVHAAAVKGFSAHASFAELMQAESHGSLDLIVAFDVFEHLSVDELNEALSDIGALLRPGGVLLARVPSGDSPFARSIQHGDLTHRLTIGSSIVRQLAVTAGLEVVAISGPAFPLFGLGVVSFLRRAMVAATRALAYPLIQRLFMGGAPVVLAPTLVFVLRKRT